MFCDVGYEDWGVGLSDGLVVFLVDSLIEYDELVLVVKYIIGFEFLWGKLVFRGFFFEKEYINFECLIDKYSYEIVFGGISFYFRVGKGICLLIDG